MFNRDASFDCLFRDVATLGRTKGGMNSKLHTVTDAAGRPLRMFLRAGQRSDYIGARALLNGLTPVEHMLADRGYDAGWYREPLKTRGSPRASLPENTAKVPIPMAKPDTASATRSRTASPASRTGGASQTRFDRCPKVFLSACALAAVVMFWLWILLGRSNGINFL